MGHLDSLSASQSVRPCVRPAGRQSVSQSVSQSVPQFVVLPSVCQSVLRPLSIRPSISPVDETDQFHHLTSALISQVSLLIAI